MFVFSLMVAAASAASTHELNHVETFIAQSMRRLTSKYRPIYHVSAPFGWLNDPAAFIYFKQMYHLFYQYYPYDGTWGPLHWGHAVSSDLIDWKHYPPALLPRDRYDQHGCLTGSVLEYNGYITLFYTGELLIANKTRQTQNVAVSSDGIVFQKYLYNPIVRDAPDGTEDFRNPKVWRFRNAWYMMVGASYRGRGRLVLYISPDLYSWRFNTTIAESYGDMGYLWESPDAFDVSGQSVLVISVRGVHTDGFRFRNLHQSGYVIGHFDCLAAKFDELEVSTATFAEFDHGHDFYAAKTTLAADGRRLLIAWLGMWESDFREAEEGWAGMMTLVREVRLGAYGRLLTPAAQEALELRSEVLEDAWYGPGEAFYAGAKAFELVVNATSGVYDVVVSLEWGGAPRYTVSYSGAHGHVTVDRGGADGERRADWSPTGRLHWRMFIDRSSVELFCGAGEVTFSSRVYPRGGISVRIGGEAQVHLTQYRIRRTVGYDKKLRNYLKDNFLIKSEIKKFPN